MLLTNIEIYSMNFLRRSYQMPKHKEMIKRIIDGIVISTIFFLIGVVGNAEVQQEDNAPNGL